MRCALCKSSAPGLCAGAERPCVPESAVPVTEAEYAARLPGRMQEIASDLTATALPDWAQDAGLHFEWVPAAEGGPPPPGEPGLPDEDEPDSDGYAVVTPGQFEDFTRKHCIRWTPQ